MRIGELSNVTGVSIATIRLYEREGLVGVASRTDGRFREFTPEQRIRLDFIKRLRNLGFTLDDVKALLGLCDADGNTRIQTLHRILQGITIRRRDLDLLETGLRKAEAGSISISDLECVLQPD
ncbi:MAG TPA: MerR family transcriptional regulator [Sphingobium sp.]